MKILHIEPIPKLKITFLDIEFQMIDRVSVYENIYENLFEVEIKLVLGSAHRVILHIPPKRYIK